MKRVVKNYHQDKRQPAAAASKEHRLWLRSRTVSPELAPIAIPEAARVPRRPLRRKAKRESRIKSHLARAIPAGALLVSLTGLYVNGSTGTKHRLRGAH